ncbi:hypothetical protein JCM10212_003851 [Sporobolomyces blumeae]
MRSQRDSIATKPTLQGSWSPSPSPSPSPRASPTPPSPVVDLSISDADRFHLLETHGPLKPSELGGKMENKGKGPLVVVSPEELEKMVDQQNDAARSGRGGARQDLDDADDDDNDDEADVEELRLWEEVANAVLWSIPFGFLFSGMDYAVHAQFGQDLVAREEIKRVLNILPALLLLNFFLSRPRSKALVGPQALQALLCGLSVATGVTLVGVTTTEGYLDVMRQAPALGVLWCWSVVRMDLAWAVAALTAVGVGVWARGQADSVMWWKV